MDITNNKIDGICYKYLKNKNKVNTLVFLHGLTGDSSIWNEYIRKFDTNFNILLIDLFGHGDSDSPITIEDYLFQNQLKIILKIIRKLKIQSIILVGYSYTAHLCLMLYNKIPKKIKSIIFVSPYFKKRRFFENIFFRSIKIIWEFLVPNKKHKLDYSKLQNYEKPTFLDIRHILKSINTKDILGSIYSFRSIREVPNLESVKVPVLVIYGENDKGFLRNNVENLNDLKNIKYVILKNKNHLFLKTESKNVSKIIKSFLRKTVS